MELPIPSDIGEYLRYEPHTGDLFWIKKTSPHSRRVKVGSRAGSVSSQGYIQLKFRGSMYKAHRIAWYLHTGEQPPSFPLSLDHENRVKHDNRIDNLRIATRSVQGQNQDTKSTNTSGHTGVSWYKSREQWVARINVDKKRITLGYFEEIADAIQARKAAEEQYWNNQ